MVDFGFIVAGKRTISTTEFMVKGSGIWIGMAISGLVAGCGSGNNPSQETPTSGTIHISVDESYRPVIDSEIKVFESSFPNAHVIPHYKAEAQCLRDLTADSTRMVLVTRGLTAGGGEVLQRFLPYGADIWSVGSGCHCRYRKQSFSGFDL
jgi:hypothetical protein